MEGEVFYSSLSSLCFLQVHKPRDLGSFSYEMCLKVCTSLQSAKASLVKFLSHYFLVTWITASSKRFLFCCCP